MKELRNYFNLALAASVGSINPAVALSTPGGLWPSANNTWNSSAPSTSDWWFAKIDRRGTVPFIPSYNYTIFRNVKDYGAVGDGVVDDTAAINHAITAGGNRCGKGCDSSTTAPGILYFPPGTYLVSSPIVAYYYTQIIGDASSVPTLKASSNFSGIAVIDADPYNDQGNNWFTNQNNFFRQVRNFKIDLTSQPMTTGTGIHWQVAQASSLQNIEFNMIVSKNKENSQRGIFMENGSGGFMTDLTFNGGRYGMVLGSEQFTSRNLRFNNCQTAIFQIWNWVWTYHGLSINNCDIGIDITSGDPIQSVGSIIVQDSVFSNTSIGITTLYDPSQEGANGTMILDNVNFLHTPVAVQNTRSGKVVLHGSANIASWIQGRAYVGKQGRSVQAAYPATQRPAALVDSKGNIFTKSKNQYLNVDASKFISVKARGAIGNGLSDDTAAIQAIFDAIKPDEVVFFDHGAYLITDTVFVPPNVRIVGEIWPLIMAGGNTSFNNPAHPKPVFKIGKPGDVGIVEISDLIFETQGPQPGAILMEWNVGATSKGSTGLWDVHFRVGGSAGTGLQSDTCGKSPDLTTTPKPECFGAWMLLHVTADASIYMENTWLWVADHELDLPDHSQINIYSGRGIMIESTKGTWLWGTASEHNVLYNYQLRNARNVYMATIQTETAYFQGNPDARVPFKSQASWDDPDFSSCSANNCARTWGLRVLNCEDVFLYGGGLYSFFDNYGQDCLNTESCQESIIDIQHSKIKIFGVSTKASVNIINNNGSAQMVHDADNLSSFCATVAVFEQ
ncbi:exo-beta-1,3-glucanase [Pochonia chlamydosporia 170]|uniref:Exo-beta-1,3-glucanase n=1 Tax=Pochonia chlamydosporia 170 TaxID=1380566 RepID=A0A179F9R8_METCM|nr:exo-beta-1,3-glucanase [Pochonia chlamydosporia 170]OAQ61839.1 exo-beta-1,3-glucanase [Pochonia chlamydosporia 170]